MNDTFISKETVDSASEFYSLPFGPLGELVDIRTYRRWIPEKLRRETFFERNARVVNYNLGLAVGKVSTNALQEEADDMYKMLNELKVWPSGRTAWVGGTSTTEQNPAANFNCSFLAINRMEAFADLNELLMLGTGVGFRVHSKDISKLPVVVNWPELIFENLKPVPKDERRESTIVRHSSGDQVTISVGDSREGWIDALRLLFASYTGLSTDITHIEGFEHVAEWAEVGEMFFEFNHVRPMGERIKGFGGTASGADALKGILKEVSIILEDVPTEDTGFDYIGKIRSIDAMDICCAIAKGVVAGSSRRSALICLFEEGDELCAQAKRGLYTNPDLASKSYRSQSNNTENIGAADLDRVKKFLFQNPSLHISSPFVEEFLKTVAPSVEELAPKFETVKTEGEPGFDNWARMVMMRFYAAKKWRPNLEPQTIWENYCDVGTNPCFKAGTLVLTKQGHYPIELLVGKTVDIWDGNQWVTVDNFRVTGKDKEVYDVELHSGQVITATDNHTFVLADGTKKKLFELQEGDELLSHEVQVHGDLKEAGAYLKGFLLGDGTSTSDRPLLHLYDTKYACAERLINSCKELPIRELVTNAISEPSFKEPVGNKSLMRGLSVRKHELFPWVSTQRENLSYDVLNWSYESKLEFLAGLFDADGSASDTKNGFTYQITSVHKKTLNMVQLLLQSIGVYSTLRCKNDSSRFDGTYDFGEDKGGICNIKPAYRLNINQANSIKFASQVSFTRLSDFSQKTTKVSYREKSFRIRSISYNSVASEVYCATIPTNNQLSLSCNTVTGNCHEIILSAGLSQLKGEAVSFCNLTTVPLPNHLRIVEGTGYSEAINSFGDTNLIKLDPLYELDLESLEAAFRMATRIGLRQTCVEMPYEHMSLTQEDERLLGVSATGWRDLFDALEWETGDPRIEDLQKSCRYWCNDEATRYAKELDVPRPLLVTTIKPEGTASQIFGTGSGLHWDWAPYYIRRVRMSATDALAQTLIQQGFSCYPELYDLSEWKIDYTSIPSIQHEVDIRNLEAKSKRGIKSFFYNLLTGKKKYTDITEQDVWNSMDNWQKLNAFDELTPALREAVLLQCNTVVFEFPVKSLAKQSQGDVSAIEQLENMKSFTVNYCDHMPSSTITVKPEEWDDVIQWVSDNWENFTTASFLPYYGGGYPLLPNEEIDRTEYERRLAAIPDVYKRHLATGKVMFKVDEGLLGHKEVLLADPDDIILSDGGCSTGACPIR